MEVLRVSGWSTTFENAGTRKLKTLAWVPVPVGTDSAGYQDILETFGPVKGAAIYGAWVQLLGVAATCRYRGYLCRANGEPLTISSIAFKTRLDEGIITDLLVWALPFGWLESYWLPP